MRNWKLFRNGRVKIVIVKSDDSSPRYYMYYRNWRKGLFQPEWIFATRHFVEGRHAKEYLFGPNFEEKGLPVLIKKRRNEI